MENPAVEAALKRMESRPVINSKNYKPENGWNDWSDWENSSDHTDWQDSGDGPRY